MDCLASPDLTLGELSRELLAKLGGSRYPFSCTFELTERCNLACVQCYINQPPASREALAREMTVSQIEPLLDQMAEVGCLYALLTGGEVLLRPDFPDIYRCVKQRGMLVSVFTNATLLSPRIADFLAEWRPWTIEISLYGHTQDTYERVTRVPGSFARCRRGIELALDRSLHVHLKSVVLSANRHELTAMQAFARGLGVPFRYDPLLWPRLDRGDDPLAYRLSLEEIASLDWEDAERQQEWAELHKQFPSEDVRAESVYGCGAGWHGFHVDCAGRLSMCMMARRPAYDLLEGNFHEGWETFLGALVRQTRALDTPCRTCTVGVLCTQCPGWSQAVHGDSETPVELVCALGRRRAAAVRSAGLSHSAGSGPRDERSEPILTETSDCR